MASMILSAYMATTKDRSHPNTRLRPRAPKGLRSKCTDSPTQFNKDRPGSAKLHVKASLVFLLSLILGKGLSVLDSGKNGCGHLKEGSPQEHLEGATSRRSTILSGNHALAM